MEDKAEDMQAFINNERREEIQAVEEQRRDYNEQMTREATHSGIMALNMLLNQADERCRELRRQIVASREF